MKRFFFIFFLSICFMDAESQSIFKVIKTERNYFIGSDSCQNENIEYYRITLSNDSFYLSPTYPLPLSSFHIDTIKAIKELLALKGDQRICAIPVNNYNPMRSQIYLGSHKNYSIQVEALFIINQLVFNDKFKYSSYPILVNKESHAEETISGKTISEAFKAYSRWYEMLKKMGISNIVSKRIMPLDGSNIRWY